MCIEIDILERDLKMSQLYGSNLIIYYKALLYLTTKKEKSKVERGATICMYHCFPLTWRLFGRSHPVLKLWES